MKLIKGNKLIFVLVCVFYACHQKAETEFLIGHWKYEAVNKNGQSIIPIKDNDQFILRADSSFEYHIESVNKHMYGHWTYTDHTLHLDYDSPPALRHFKIDILSKYTLEMHEDSVTFLFHSAQ